VPASIATSTWTGLTDFLCLSVAELFANIGMHGYIANNEPTRFGVGRRLPAHLGGARRPLAGPRSRPHGAGARVGPLNYVWFRLGQLVIDTDIWQAGGPAAP
jgi:hypothetical protein